MGRYSNHDNVTKLQRILAGQGRERPPARTTRSLRQIQHRLTADKVQQLIELYTQGELIEALAAKFHISRTTVMKHVERAGVPRHRNMLTDRVNEARQLYDQGWSLAKIRQHLGVNASTVWHALRKAGVPMRDTHGR